VLVVLVKRYSKSTSLMGILIHILLVCCVKGLTLFRGYLSFLEESLVEASIASLSALHGFGVGGLVAIATATGNTFFQSRTTYDINALLLTFLLSLARYVALAGFLGIIVDTPEKVGRVALWTYLALVIVNLFLASIMGNPDYFINFYLPRASVEFLAAALLSLNFVFVYSLFARALEGKPGENRSLRV